MPYDVTAEAALKYEEVQKSHHPSLPTPHSLTLPSLPASGLSLFLCFPFCFLLTPAKETSSVIGYCYPGTVIAQNTVS